MHMEATLTAEWIKKMCFIYINTHTHIYTQIHTVEYYLVTKKNEIMTLATT